VCNLSHLPTNLVIDDRLLAEAVKVGGHRTKKTAVTAALEEYIRRRKQKRILKLFGKIELDPVRDFKKQRGRA
jgi:Arc/MetJ family transcription regulator